MSSPKSNAYVGETPVSEAEKDHRKISLATDCAGIATSKEDDAVRATQAWKSETERHLDKSSLLNLDDERRSAQRGVSSRIGRDTEGRTKEPNEGMHSLPISPNPTINQLETERQDSGQDNAQKKSDNGDPPQEVYLYSTPKTPSRGIAPQREIDDRAEAQVDNNSRSEIESIMDQFGDGEDTGGSLDRAALDTANTLLKSSVQHPPRRSSLEPLISVSSKEGPGSKERQASHDPVSKQTALHDDERSPNSEGRELPIRTSSLPLSSQLNGSDPKAPSSPTSSRSLSKVLPPAPDPEPDLPFDFHRFLEQLRHRTADPVAKFLRSFLVEFGKKQWMVHEQIKIISDFLTFITSRMAQCEIWRGVSDAEFDNAREGMEKLVMNRLYSQTFSPAIPPPTPSQGNRAKKKNMEMLLGPSRKGQHQEDIERDEILGQKVRIYGWVEERHLDISPIGESGRRFLTLAQQELLKIKSYRAPRDKVICVLNCCKVIFGLLRNSKVADTSADSFVPLLIYVVLHADPDHLVSNVQYILRFRNQEKLGGEAGYYLSSLMGAIQFIENLDRTSLTVSDNEFEKKVEEAVSAIAERHQEDMPTNPPSRHVNSPQIPEKSSLSQPEVIPRNSIDAEYSTPHRLRANHGPSMENDGPEDGNAVSGLLRTIQRPLSNLGRMFSEEAPHMSERLPTGPPQPSTSGGLSPAVFQPPPNDDEEPSPVALEDRSQDKKVSAEDAAARQASAEAAEAQRIQRAEHASVVETLAGIFPNLDRDVIDDVVQVKQGRVGLAVDACLALNS